MHFGGLKAVSEVSFEVEEGSITALIGPNGAGKTTVFNAISRQQESTGGRICFEETELAKLIAADAARQGMARTFQNLRIFVNMSVLENVLVGCHRHEHSGFWSGGLGLARHSAEERQSRARPWMRLPWWGWRRRPIGRRPAFPMVSSVWSRSPGRWRRSPACSCSTSPRPG